MTPEEFEQYANDAAQAEAKDRCDTFIRFWSPLGGKVRYGPGHVVIDDLNWGSIPFCLNETANAIRARLAGEKGYDDLTLTQLAATYEFLVSLRDWMAQLWSSKQYA